MMRRDGARRRLGGAWLLSCVLALAAAGCADRLPVDAAGSHTALPPASTSSNAVPVATPPEATPPVATHPAEPVAAAPAAPVTPNPTGAAVSTAPAGTDTCGAAALAYLVGKPRTEIPIPVDMTRRRVVCETCPVTQDFRPDRQTITFDSTTGKVTKVTCG